MKLYSFYPSVEDVDDNTIVIAKDIFKDRETVKVITHPTDGKILTLKVLKVAKIVTATNDKDESFIDISNDHIGISWNNLSYLSDGYPRLLSVFKIDKNDLKGA